MKPTDALALRSCARAVTVAVQSVRAGKPQLAHRGLGRAQAQVDALAHGRPAHARIVRNARAAVERAQKAVRAAEEQRSRAKVAELVRGAERSAEQLIESTSKAR